MVLKKNFFLFSFFFLFFLTSLFFFFFFKRHIGVYGYSACEYEISIAFDNSCSCPHGAKGSCSGNSKSCICDDGWVGAGCKSPLHPLTRFFESSDFLFVLNIIVDLFFLLVGESQLKM